jgi:hypothetical protein
MDTCLYNEMPAPSEKLAKPESFTRCQVGAAQGGAAQVGFAQVGAAQVGAAQALMVLLNC